MRELYAMFQGSLTPDQVQPGTDPHPLAQFYAHLYIGLYSEATGDVARALGEISAAASEINYGGVMRAVSRMHRDRLGNRP